MQRAVSLVVLVGALVVTTSAVVAAQPQQGVTGRAMLARVVDEAGQTLVDLGLDDFVVEEAGEVREVLDVHVADYPVAILVDDLSLPDSLDAIKAATARFISRIGERPVAIVALSRPSTLLASFENEHPVVLRSLAELSMTAAPSQPLIALATLAQAIRETGASFSAVVIVTANPVDARDLVESSALPAILETGTIIHVVERRPSAADQLADQPPPDLYQVLSNQTKGQYTTIFSSASFPVALDRLADRLSTELMVEFLVPPNGTAGDVRAGVRRPGARVLGLGVK